MYVFGKSEKIFIAAKEVFNYGLRKTLKTSNQYNDYLSGTRNMKGPLHVFCRFYE